MRVHGISDKKFFEERMVPAYWPSDASLDQPPRFQALDEDMVRRMEALMNGSSVFCNPNAQSQEDKFHRLGPSEDHSVIEHGSDNRGVMHGGFEVVSCSGVSFSVSYSSALVNVRLWSQYKNTAEALFGSANVTCVDRQTVDSYADWQQRELDLAPPSTINEVIDFKRSAVSFRLSSSSS